MLYTGKLPYTTVYYHNPLGRFSMLDISTVGVVSVPKVSVPKGSALQTFTESFPKTYRWRLAPCWSSSNRARKTVLGGCDIKPSYTVVPF